MLITSAKIAEARHLLLPPGSIATEAACLAAVERLGFVWVFTPGNCLVPALFPALATESEGQRWDWMWGWKDHLSATRQAYYGKVVGGRPTFVSQEWLPVFYALTGNTGDLDDDLLHLQETVRLHDLAMKVYGYIRNFGPTGTRTLQAKLTDGTREMKNGLEKAIEQLDTGMLIVKCGTEGGNSIGNLWDLFPRFCPEAVEAGTELPTREAAVRLMRRFFDLTPAATVRQVGQLFPWHAEHQQKAIARLLTAGELAECSVDGKEGLRRADFAEG